MKKILLFLAIICCNVIYAEDFKPGANQVSISGSHVTSSDSYAEGWSKWSESAPDSKVYMYVYADVYISATEGYKQEKIVNNLSNITEGSMP